jgi:Tfp pilus assembly protein PilW
MHTSLEHTNIRRAGFSLVEMLIYISILAVVLILLVQVVLSFSSNYRELSTLRLVERSATESLERMTRDIRNATTVTIAESTLDAHPGVLTIVATQGTNSTTTKFYTDASGKVKVDVNGSYIGPLTTSKVTVTDLKFRLLTTTVSKAVKIEITLRGVYGTITQTRSYNATVVLKGS